MALLLSMRTNYSLGMVDQPMNLMRSHMLDAFSAELDRLSRGEFQKAGFAVTDSLKRIQIDEMHPSLRVLGFAAEAES